MWTLNDDTIVLGLSDVHLGAYINHHKLLIFFLNRILDNYRGKQKSKKNLKAIIILGDFFDIIMESVRDYCRTVSYPGGFKKGENYENIIGYGNTDKRKDNYEEIFKLLRMIKDEEIKVYFTLGNHEINILGNLDKNYTKRKVKLLDEFSKNKFQYNDLFNKDNVWQYYILKADNKEWKLGFYDSRKEIIESPQENLFMLKGVQAPDKQYNCLMTHGIQFETFLRKYGGGIPWYIGLKSPDGIKELGNILYNKVFKLNIRLIDKVFDTWLTETRSVSRKIYRNLLRMSLISPFLMIIKIFNKLLKFVARKRDKIKNEVYLKQIGKKFFPKLVKEGYKGEINNIIFGHTHKDRKETDEPVFWENKYTGKRCEADVANAGAWQQIDIPTSFEINTNGDIDVYPLRFLKLSIFKPKRERLPYSTVVYELKKIKEKEKKEKKRREKKKKKEEKKRKK